MLPASSGCVCLIIRGAEPFAWCMKKRPALGELSRKTMHSYVPLVGHSGIMGSEQENSRTSFLLSTLKTPSAVVIFFFTLPEFSTLVCHTNLVKKINTSRSLALIYLINNNWFSVNNHSNHPIFFLLVCVVFHAHCAFWNHAHRQLSISLPCYFLMLAATGALTLFKQWLDSPPHSSIPKPPADGFSGCQRTQQPMALDEDKRNPPLLWHRGCQSASLWGGTPKSATLTATSDVHLSVRTYVSRPASPGRCQKLVNLEAFPESKRRGNSTADGTRGHKSSQRTGASSISMF